MMCIDVKLWSHDGKNQRMSSNIFLEHKTRDSEHIIEDDTGLHQNIQWNKVEVDGLKSLWWGLMEKLQWESGVGGYTRGDS